MRLQDQWDVASAMEVLQHQSVDAKLWAEAVEWLILYGPQPIREILLSSSDTATHRCFPTLRPQGYSADGQPCYAVADLAESLSISSEEAQALLIQKEKSHEIHHFIDPIDTMKLQ